ncbi:MAG: hypothetical protein EBZ89_14735 [Chloroflexi bacterium]|nr:hypothetical protein [Chloroflexota bacterium]
MTKQQQAFITVVVLNDGETFTDIAGCSICVVPYEQYTKAIDSGGDARDFEPVVEIGLDSIGGTRSGGYTMPSGEQPPAA